MDHRVGRTLFCLIPVWFTMITTVYLKLQTTVDLTYLVYFDSRFLLIASVVLPGILFRLEERKQLLICLGSTSVFLLFYDPIHELFGVGYFQKGFNEASYNYINYIVSVTYTVLLFGILLMRAVLERSERELIQQNLLLFEKQNEIEAQHEELLQQQEEMVASTEKLGEANEVILLQQEKLQKYNETLEAVVEEKSFELVSTNEELIKHNNELLQFSYTVSHNLRGPVARLLGLTHLMKFTDNGEEKRKIEDFVVRSSEELDEILKDLSLIIDIRNDLYRVRERILLQTEWNKAYNLLGESVKSIYNLSVDFSAAPYVYGIRPMVQSVFYNLLSNAIKYQSPDRKLKVEVVSSLLDDYITLIEVRDNGLGIDLKNQQQNVFKLYKRFHSHVSGKGLGLYLVKTQLETMGGSVKVESEPNTGTTFKLVFHQPDEVTKQVFYDNEAVQFYYNGNLNTIIIQWKKQVDTATYRKTFFALLESLQTYHTHGWISDLRKQGDVTEEDQLWFTTRIIPDLVKSGLKRLAVIGLDVPRRRDYFDRVSAASRAEHFELQVFSSLEDALAWMGNYNAVAEGRLVDY